MGGNQAVTHALTGIGTGANGTVYEVVLQPDGKPLFGGRFTAINGVTRQRIARLNTCRYCLGSLTPLAAKQGVTDEHIAVLVGADRPLPEICQSLIDAANDAGGPDNITVVLIRVDSADVA